MVQLRGISKSYGGVHALRSIDLEIRAGEVLAVCGENGAGKSTLNKILSGSVAPDSGVVVVEGQDMPLGSVQEAEKAGIAIVHQESAAFLHLTATENHQMMHEPGGLWLDRAEMKRRTVESLTLVGESFDPEVPLEQRSLAQRQMTAIARAVSRNCKLLILDEPTASLSTRETDALFAVIRQMRERGVSVVYVSHRLDEVFALADRVAVLRDGSHVATKEIGDTNPQELIQLMVGRPVEFESRAPCTPGEVRLEVSNLTSGPFRDVSFTVRAGEVVALAGLVGAGRSEVARAVFGLDGYESGEIRVNGSLALVPEDRQHEGLHLPLSVRDNLMMAAKRGQAALIDPRAEAAKAEELVQSLSIKTASDLAPVASLSGGNQQKVLLGKWLATQPGVLILDEPTRGVDVGAKDQIHRLIGELAAQGVAILVISSELNEVLALGDRVLVMSQGRIAGELSKAEATQEKILELALPKETDMPVRETASKGFSRELGVGLLLLATIVLAAVVNPTFLSLANLQDMLFRIAPVIIVGSMMTLVILAREIDISVGSLMGLCAATLGTFSSLDRTPLPDYISVTICLLVGLIGGLLNGVLVTFGRIPSIIVTLGTLTLFKGITELVLGGKWIENLPSGIRAFGTGKAGSDLGFGIPYVAIMALFVALGAIWITRRSKLGLRIFALGSNPHAASLYGVRAHKVRLIVFALTGLGAGIAALFSATQLQMIESGFGNGFELVAIASVIVGGTSIRGGRGSILGTVLGATLLGIVATVLIFLKLGESATYWERAIQGGFILLAVLGDHVSRKHRRQA